MNFPIPIMKFQEFSTHDQICYIYSSHPSTTLGFEANLKHPIISSISISACISKKQGFFFKILKY